MSRTVYLPRRYVAEIDTPGASEMRYVVGRFKARHAAVDLFRRWFGREPRESWGQDGFMAQAFDFGRGLRVTLQQENCWCPFRRHGAQRAPSKIKGLLPLGGRS